MSFFNFQFWNEIGIHKKVLFHSNFKMKIEWYFWCTDWYHGWDFFYLMVKSGKSFVKIGFRFQIALRNFQPPPPPSLFRPPTYFILPNVPTTPPSPPPPPPTPLFIRDPRVCSVYKSHSPYCNVEYKIKNPYDE